MPYADPEKKREADRRHHAAHRETKRERSRQYHAAHPEAARERARQYRAAHPEAARERARQYRAAHLEAEREADRQYHAAHPEAARERDGRRRCRRREAPFVWPRVEPWATACAVCAVPFAGNYPDPRAETLGHEPPVAWLLRHPEYDGPLALRPEHLSCNLRKGARPDWELLLPAGLPARPTSEETPPPSSSGVAAASRKSGTLRERARSAVRAACGRLTHRPERSAQRCRPSGQAIEGGRA